MVFGKLLQWYLAIGVETSNPPLGISQLICAFFHIFLSKTECLTHDLFFSFDGSVEWVRDSLLQTLRVKQTRSAPPLTLVVKKKLEDEDEEDEEEKEKQKGSWKNEF